MVVSPPQRCSGQKDICTGDHFASLMIAEPIHSLPCANTFNERSDSSISKKIDSAAMAATAKDSISDSLSTVVVLITTVLTYFTELHIDGWCGVLVAFFVLWAGIGAAKDTISPLLGQPPTKEFVDRIEAIIMEYESQGVLGVHDLVVHDYGPGRMMLSVHVEVPASGDILILHDMIDLIEHRLASELGCSAVIHMDPVCVDDELTNEIKEKVAEIIHGMDGEIKFHDFRIVNGPTHTNLIFDVVVPAGYKKSEEKLVEQIGCKIQPYKRQQRRGNAFDNAQLCIDDCGSGCYSFGLCVDVGRHGCHTGGVFVRYILVAKNYTRPNTRRRRFCIRDLRFAEEILIR